MTTYPAIVGRVLAELRRERGLRQEDVARAVGLGQATWSKIERGDSPLTVEQLAAAADAMGVAPAEVLRIADEARRLAEARGVVVEGGRTAGALGDGLVVIASAALGVLVAEALFRRRG